MVIELWIVYCSIVLFFWFILDSVDVILKDHQFNTSRKEEKDEHRKDNKV